MRLLRSTEIENYVNNNPREAAGIIPKLLENILNELNYKINNITFSLIPSEDDIIQIGSDGYLVLKGDVDIFPAGKTLIEIGTGKNPITKANSDIKKRTKEVKKRKNINYIFLTPYSWNSRRISRQKWMEEKSNEWDKAILIDSTVLEDLLEKCFYTSLWLYEIINKSEINIRTIEKVEKDIIDTTYNHFNLSLFDYEDTEFEQELINSLNSIKNEMIRFCGETREETVYYILFLLNKNAYFKNKTIIVDSVDDWVQIKKDHFIEGYYLIANFTYNSIEFIPNNVNIVVGGKEDYVDSKNSIVLKSRLSNNLRKKLEEKISDLDEVNDIMKSCLGNKFPLLKRRIFKGKFDPKWANTVTNKETLIPALLINSWSKNNEGDIEIVEELGGKQYLPKLNTVACLEDPFIAYIEHNGKYLIANDYEAWAILFNYITDDNLTSFKSVVKKVLKYDSPVYELDPEKRNFSSIYLKDKVHYSNVIKIGVIKTMILYNQYYYRKTGSRKNFFKDVLTDYYDSINTEIKWLNSSILFDMLVEIDPELFLEKIKKSIDEKDKGLDKLFLETDDIITKRANHYNLLWALEKVLHLEDYVAESLDIIASLADNNYELNGGNSPINTLFRAFLGWDNLINIKFSEKYKLLEKILEKHTIGFELIKQVLPKRSGENWTYLCKPEYLEFELKNKITRKEIFENFKQYYLIFLKLYGRELNKIAYLYDENVFMYYDVADLVYSTTKDRIKQSDKDEEKYQIEENIRQSLHGYYRFKNEVWHMDKKDLEEQKNILDMISYDDISYKYLYLFDNYMPYIIVDMDEEEYERKDVEENYRKNAILELNGIKNYDFYNIVKIINPSKNCYLIGEYIAKYGKMDSKENIIFIKKLADNESMQNMLMQYIWGINKRYGLEETIKIIEQKEFADPKYMNLKVEFLIRCGIDKNLLDYISVNKDIEEKFWLRVYPHAKVDVEYQDIFFSKLYEYKNYRSCIEFLHTNNMIDSNKHFMVLKELYKSLIANTMDSYYINQSFKLIYRNNDLNRKDIISLEIAYYKILDEDIKLKYFQEEALKDTQYLVELAGFAYKKENESKAELTEQDQKVALNCYEIIQNLNNVKFCDATSIEWAGNFLAETKKNDQARVGENILGRLLANRTFGNDGIFPNEISREIIETFYSKSLSSGFQVEVFNSRGVYSGSSGQEEKKISEKYRNWAGILKSDYPNTSKILKEISETYHNEYLRERAESNWWEN